MQKLLARIPPAVAALVIQGIVYVTLRLLQHAAAWEFSALQLALACGVAAMLLSNIVGLAKWWLPIQLLFVPALTLALDLAVPPIYYLTAFLALLAVYWSTFETQVPLYLSSDKVQCRLEELLPVANGTGRRPSFLDLGCGVGGVLAHLAGIKPEIDFHGIETAPLPFVASLLRNLHRPNCHVKWGSFWKEDLGHYDVVYAYLSPVPMPQLWQKARREMRPGTLFVSNSFAVPEQTPQRVVEVDDAQDSRLYIWQM